MEHLELDLMNPRGYVRRPGAPHRQQYPLALTDDGQPVYGTAVQKAGPASLKSKGMMLYDDEVVDSAVRSLEISLVAKYAFGLAQAFNAFYHRQQIMREDREDARLWRAAGVVYFTRQLTRALDLMGCAVPSRM